MRLQVNTLDDFSFMCGDLLWSLADSGCDLALVIQTPKYPNNVLLSMYSFNVYAAIGAMPRSCR